MLMRCMEELNGRCDMKEKGKGKSVMSCRNINGRGGVKENRMEEVV